MSDAGPPVVHLRQFPQEAPRSPLRSPESILDALGGAAALAGAAAAVRGVYLHVPFCFHKCHYCDFYSVVDRRDRQEAYVDRLEREIAWIRPYLRAPIDTVFIGGGTPTLLAPARLRRVLAAVRSLPLAGDAEVTVEANPETVTSEIADVLAAAAVTRVSVGCQSFRPEHLRMLERWHDPASVGRAVGHLRAAGIVRVNLDLIFAIPGQSLQDWAEDIDQALALDPSHLSCYGLVYEPGTPLAARLAGGEVGRVEEETEAAMFEHVRDRLAQAGFEQYEISNWARPGERCRHNVLYWTNGSWWPLGPGAAGHAGGARWKNRPSIDAWLMTDGPPPITGFETFEPDRAVGESFMLGLRLLEGMPVARVEELLQTARGAARRVALARAVDGGLLEHVQDRLRLTARGILLADAVLADLV